MAERQAVATAIRAAFRLADVALPAALADWLDFGRDDFALLTDDEFRAVVTRDPRGLTAFRSVVPAPDADSVNQERARRQAVREQRERERWRALDRAVVRAVPTLPYVQAWNLALALYDAGLTAAEAPAWLAEATDAEILRIPGVGRVSLRHIRAVHPSPDASNRAGWVQYAAMLIGRP